MHPFRHFLPSATRLLLVLSLLGGSVLFGQNPQNPCDDGDPNTVDYVDSTGRCHHVATICCDDGNDCTLDRYDPVKKDCVHEPLPNCVSCTVDTDKDGKVDCEDPCPEDAKNGCCPGLVSNGCTPQLKVDFLSCYEVIVCSSKKIDYVILDIGPTGVDPSDVTYRQFQGQKGHILNKDKRIKGIWVRSGCIPGIPGCPECGVYYPNPNTGCDQCKYDSDGDGVNDCEDECPWNKKKSKEGYCGCYGEDKDTDGDKIPDCADECPTDPKKTNPGECGCGTPDTDADKDGIIDCEDECPNDPNKTKADCCGCGVPETDTDMDKVPDCKDECPNDPNKTKPGLCGCGVADEDKDGDNIVDCNDPCPDNKNNDCEDLCPDDPNKTNPGACGCGVPDTDTDGDGTPDCKDKCPEDPNKKYPGTCGCGTPDTDTDMDGSPDCKDECPNNPNKIKPGICGCDEDDVDSDMDGIVDCKDNCPDDRDNNCDSPCPDLTSEGCVPEVKATFDGCGKVTVCSAKDLSNVVLDLAPYGPGPEDVKYDGLSGYSAMYTSMSNILGVWIKSGCNQEDDPDLQCPGCGEYIPNPNRNCAEPEDNCPNDPNKTEPGACGCGVADTDSDGDGTPNCDDDCPNDPDKTEPGDCGCNKSDRDSDGDGTPNCDDDCPNDPNKTEPGDCGCGVADTDTDNDGTPNCDDDCPNDPNKTEPGDCGCGVADTDSDNDGTPNCDDDCPNDPNKTEPGDCGCGVAEGTCNDPCDDLESNGSIPEVYANFTSCTSVFICSAKDLSNVVLDIAPYGPSSSDIKFDGLNDPSGTFTSGGAAILGVWIKSGSNFEDDPNLQCPGCGEYVDNPLDCNMMLTAPELSTTSGQVLLQNRPSRNLTPQTAVPVQEVPIASESRQKQLAKAFKIFPNPGKSDFRIDLKDYAGKTANILVFDLSGKLIKKQEFEIFPGGLIDLAMPNQAPGMYQVKILFKDAEPLLGSFIIQE